MQSNTSLLLPKSAFEMALQRSSVALARDKRSVAVKLSRGEDGVYITSSAAGQSSSECVSSEPGDEIEIGFDARYMMNAISVFGQGEVRMEFANEQAPIHITSQTQPSIKMLVMPCKIA